MEKLKKVKRVTSNLISRLDGFRQLLIAKDPGYEIGAIDRHFKRLRKELVSQSNDLIDQASIPPEPREANEILEELVSTGELSEELLSEIKRSLEKNKKKVKDGKK